MSYGEDVKKPKQEGSQTQQGGGIMVEGPPGGNGGGDLTARTLQALLTRILAITPQPDPLADLQYLVQDYRNLLVALGATPPPAPKATTPATNPNPTAR